MLDMPGVESFDRRFGTCVDRLEFATHQIERAGLDVTGGEDVLMSGEPRDVGPVAHCLRFDVESPDSIRWPTVALRAATRQDAEAPFRATSHRLWLMASRIDGAAGQR
jgi:hypothetical protein